MGEVSLLKRLRIALMRSALTRTEYLVKHRIFAGVGRNFFFQPRIVPINADCIRFHDNDAVASGVTFINHDVIHKVFNQLDPARQCGKKYGCIEVMDNVFIGSNATILYGVRIGPNAVVAAGSLVTKDVPPGTVVGGVPARVIGSFDDLYRRRLQETEEMSSWSAEDCWKAFYREHGETGQNQTGIRPESDRDRD